MLKTKARQQPLAAQSLWNALKIILALLLVGYVASQTNLSDLGRLWQRISLPWLAASAALFGAIVWAMAGRYWVLIDRKITFRQTLVLVVVQTFVGNLLAASTGAISYVALLRSKHQIQLSQGVTSVLMAKFGDLLALYLALGLASWAVWPQIAPLHWLLGIVLLGISAVVLVFGAVVLFRRRVLGLAQRLLQIARLDRIRLIGRLLEQLDLLASQDPRRLRALLRDFLAYSVLSMGLSLAFGYCNLLMFGVHLDLWSVLFIAALTQLISIIPIQVFGGLGIFEITSLYLYNLFRVDQQLITPMIVSSRLYLYLLNVLLVLFWLIEGYLSRRAETKQAHAAP